MHTDNNHVAEFDESSSKFKASVIDTAANGINPIQLEMENQSNDKKLNNQSSDTQKISPTPEKTDTCPHGPACAICLDSLNGKLELLDVPDCGHRFHKKCLTRWKLLKQTCPYCRGNITHVGPQVLNIWGVAITTEPVEPPTKWSIARTLLFSPIGCIYSILLSVIFVLGGLLFVALWLSIVTAVVSCDFLKKPKLVFLIPVFIIMALSTFVTQVFSLLYYLTCFYVDLFHCKCDWQFIHYRTIFPAILITHRMMISAHNQLEKLDELFIGDAAPDLPRDE